MLLVFLSLRKSQGFQELCARNWGRYLSISIISQYLFTKFGKILCFFPPLLLKILFSISFALLSFWGSNYMYVKLVNPQISRVLSAEIPPFPPQFLFSLFFRLDNFCEFIFKFTNSSASLICC